MCSGLSSPMFSSTKSFRRKGQFSFSFLWFFFFFFSLSSLTYPWKASVFADFIPEFGGQIQEQGVVKEVEKKWERNKKMNLHRLQGEWEAAERASLEQVE